MATRAREYGTDPAPVDRHGTDQVAQDGLGLQMSRELRMDPKVPSLWMVQRADG